ncbi:hypothetical protein GCM10010964_37640 [Caldovatus sediminis]|uniref:Ketosynthase n=1 Tax=Caldovatus sediminis TaxID=2041189 RepID=A0A8J2ZE21_9PROT|nr:hypothetical protein [Caldovatus sediminis]GGG46756.1 hypothetical protein GCM10010964_37640 [Caldovatus sediminis]
MAGEPPSAASLPLALTGLLGAGFVLARALGADGLAAAALAAGLAMAVATSGRGAARRGRLGGALGLAGLAAAVAVAPPPWLGHALDALPPLCELLLALVFAATLLPGREPLIARYTRLDRGVVPPECEGYARRLTAFWAALLALLAIGHGLVLAGVLAVPDGVLLAVNPGLVAAVFLAEHLVRTLRFPHLGIASPLRTCRVVLRAGWHEAALAPASAAPRRPRHAA